MGVIGGMKAVGKMPHAASRTIGRGELLGALFFLLPRAAMKGLGGVAGCAVIFAVMGAMMAIKPKAFLTEALFVTLTSKLVAAEWSVVALKELTAKVQWEQFMLFFIVQGMVLGLGVRIFNAGGGSKVGAAGRVKGTDSKKRTKRA
jgi:hypothetical protein